MFKINKHLESILIIILTIISVSLFWKNNLILTLILSILAILILFINNSKENIYTFIFCGIIGSSAEIIAIHFGAWNYSNPNFLKIPIWLIILWGIASIFIIRINLTLKKYLNKK